MTTLKPHPTIKNALIGGLKNFGLTITKNADGSETGILTFFGFVIWTFNFTF
jgi:hypothetical protein